MPGFVGSEVGLQLYNHCKLQNNQINYVSITQCKRQKFHIINDNFTIFKVMFQYM